MILNSAAYEDICDYVILIPQDLDKLIKNFELFKRDCVIYCKTDFTPLLFHHLQFSKRNYILVTHHSDYIIDENRFKTKPSCIKKWFALNPTYVHPDLIAIPLGTKTPEGRAYHESQYEINWFVNNILKLRNTKKNVEKVYCNWKITNENRKIVYDKLIKNVNCYLTSNLSFKEYCEDMAKYQFVISPQGNGIDCHRTWEALYMGCFPIVIKNYIYTFWKELPIIQVNDYSEVTYDLLNLYLNKSYNYSKAYIHYWKNYIKNFIK
jgi:hypothetical protein